MEIEGGPLPVFKYGPITPFITSDGTHLVEMDERLKKHPRSLTSPLKRDHFERKVVFQPSIYIHVHPFTWAMFNFSGVFCGGGMKVFLLTARYPEFGLPVPQIMRVLWVFFFFLGGDYKFGSFTHMEVNEGLEKSWTFGLHFGGMAYLVLWCFVNIYFSIYIYIYTHCI